MNDHLRAVTNAWRAARRNRRRANLTVISIAVGVAAVMGLQMAGDIVTRMVASQFDAIAGRENVHTLALDEGTLSLPQLTEHDVEMLARAAADFDAVVSPSLATPALVAALDGANIDLVGVSSDLPRLQTTHLTVGRWISDDDVESRRRVGVVNEALARRLVSAAGSDGDVALAGGAVGHVAIVGIVSTSGGPKLFVPWTSLYDMAAFTPTNQRVFVQAGRPTATSDVADAMAARFEQATGRSLLAFDAGAEGREAATRTVRALQRFLLGVIVIALVVGGLGIANVMYMSLGERTREIAIRRAFGATASDVRRAFLLEAIVLGAVGGAVGIWLGTAIVSAVTSWITASGGTASLDLVTLAKAAWLSALLGAGVGAVAGYGPSLKAAGMPVSDALQTR